MIKTTFRDRKYHSLEKSTCDPLKYTMSSPILSVWENPSEYKWLTLDRNMVLRKVNLKNSEVRNNPENILPCISTVLQAKSDSDFMFCLQSYQWLIIDRSLVY